MSNADTTTSAEVENSSEQPETDREIEPTETGDTSAEHAAIVADTSKGLENTTSPLTEIGTVPTPETELDVDSSSSPLSDPGSDGKPRLTIETNQASAENHQSGGATTDGKNEGDAVGAESQAPPSPVPPNNEDDDVASDADSDIEEDHAPQFAPQSQDSYVYPRYEISQAM